MANSTASIKPMLTKTDTTRSILIIGALFFIFGSVTWVNSILIPYLKIACELNNFESYLVAFAFFISYFVMGIPSAWVLKATGYKKGMTLGLVIMAVGALLFIPAALSRTYGLFLLGLFIQGTGLTILQAASNPYITIIGPRESAAKRISIMGICNKVGGALSSFTLGTILLLNSDVIVDRLQSMDLVQKTAELNALAGRVIMPYTFVAAVLLILALLVHLSSLPEIETEQEDETIAVANTKKTSILQFPHLMLGVLTLFLYVGVEVMSGDTIVSYGATQGFALDKATIFTTYMLASMVVGYLIGIVTIPKYISQEKALQVSAILGVIFSVLAISTSGFTSVLFIALLGLANSIMWPAIFPMAIAGLGRFTKIGSSLLIMGIAGGALLPPLYGLLADNWNAQQAYWIMVPCYLFIWFYAAKGHKIKS